MTMTKAIKRARAVAAILSTAILGIVALASCATTSTVRDTPNQSPKSAHGPLTQPVGESVRHTIARYRNDPDSCRSAIADAGGKFTMLPDTTEPLICTLTNAVQLNGVRMRYSQPTKFSCPMAAAMTAWEVQIVAPSAVRHLNSPVVGIEIWGSYNCRTRNSKPGAPISEHGTGNAADIAGFLLKDGRKIMVEQTWNTKTPEAAFLRDVRDRSCSLFNGVISPDENYEHRNHLHFDLGQYRFCQ